MKTHTILVLLTIFLLQGSALNLQGTWQVQTIANKPVDLTLTISEIIFRQEQVIYKMQWTGCKTLLYQMDTQGDNIWIDVASQWEQNVSPCSSEQSQYIDLVKKHIPGTLKFNINHDKLKIMNPSYDPVFNMKRQINQTREAMYKNIEGQWLVQFVNDPKNAHSMNVSPKKISICAGATFSYDIKAKYYIDVKNQQLGGCQDFELINNLLKVVFYQKYQNKVLMYDNQIKLVLTAISNNRPAEIKQTQVAPTPQISPIPQGIPAVNSGPIVVSQPTPESGFISGNYLLLLLYFRSQGRRKVQISSSAITVQQCSKMVFEYKIVNNQDLTVASASNYDEGCPKANEKKIWETIMSAKKYKVSPDATINLIDGEGKEVITLNLQ